jgi:subtilisin family serine protease
LLYAGHDPEGRTGSVWFYTGGGDTFYNGQFIGPALGLPAAQARTTGESTVVAVLDTGIDPAHPALAGVIEPGGFNFVAGGGETDDPVNGHGTFVAGLIHFVAPNAALLPIVVLDGQGAGDAWGFTCGMFYAIDQGVDVINLSLGSTYESNAAKAALAEATSLGIAVVAAGGNQGVEEPEEFPAAEEGAIGVAAVDHLDVKAGFSNYNDKFFISAPGTSLPQPGAPDGYDPAHTVFSTLPGGQYGFYDGGGTSLSAAMVSGAVALLRAQHPETPVDMAGLNRIRCLLERSAVNIDAINAPYAGMLGAGRLDAGRAVLMSAGDIDGDGTVGTTDFLALLSAWGPCAPQTCLADLDCDGSVGIADFLTLLSNWG